MPHDEQIEVFSHAINSCIVRMPERRFPGVVIQGDGLSILFSTAMELVESLEQSEDRETFLSALLLAQHLEAHIQNYEETLEANDIELPYFRDKERSTQKYQHYWKDQGA